MADKYKVPKELQEYHKEIKKLSFREKLVKYFSLSTVFNTDVNDRRELIRSTFTKEELNEYYTYYSPILVAINEYEDRVRTIKVNSDEYSIYISNLLRQRDFSLFTVDWLNRAKKNLQEGARELNIKEEDILSLCRKVLGEPNPLKSTFPYGTKIKYNPEEILYYGDTENTEYIIGDTLKELVNMLIALKSYLLSLREFLESVKALDLYPEEFKRMEADLRNRYFGTDIEKDTLTRESKRAEGDFPNFWGARTEAEKEYLSLCYDSLPTNTSIFGEGNLWRKAYLFSLTED